MKEKKKHQTKTKQMRKEKRIKQNERVQKQEMEKDVNCSLLSLARREKQSQAKATKERRVHRHFKSTTG